MYRYTFSGRIHPERSYVTLPTVTSNVKDEESGLSGVMTVMALVGQVEIIFKTENEIDNIKTLKNSVEYMARGIVDAFGYRKGRGYELELISVLLDDNYYEVFGVNIEALELDESNRPFQLTEIIQQFNKSPFLVAALADYRQAIRVAHETGFLCYRSAESIMQHFKESEGSGKDRIYWESMRENLNIDKNLIMYIKSFSDERRHGKTKSISGEDRTRLLLKTARIIDRFLVYLISDKKLQESSYPILNNS